MISERPDDRAIPGHWEGDLITGEGNRSAIGTLVERTTRYVMLPHLPIDYTAEAVRDALTKTVLTLRAHLRRSLTWDQGLGFSGRCQFQEIVPSLGSARRGVVFYDKWPSLTTLTGRMTTAPESPCIRLSCEDGPLSGLVGRAYAGDRGKLAWSD